VNHAAKATSALATIKKVGTTFTLSKITVTPSGSEPWKQASSSTATETVYGILEDFSGRERDGTIVRERDRRYLVAASGISAAPIPGDELTDGSDQLRVQSVQTIRSGSVDVLHYLHARI